MRYMLKSIAKFEQKTVVIIVH